MLLLPRNKQPMKLTPLKKQSDLLTSFTRRLGHSCLLVWLVEGSVLENGFDYFIALSILV